jgi:cysteinyl-tRNA synthetase
VDDLISETRELEGQEEKRFPADFALWKSARPEHIMRWSSPWSDGFPGWHLECSVMGAKYLGVPFDIHGGGMDLLFPHHESEIAQSVAAYGIDPVKYWMHNNMITLNGQKMGKSLGNAINLDDFFAGNHALLNKPYSPMTIRFFMLQAHYRSTLDFSNEALQAAEKGLKRLFQGIETLNNLTPAEASTVNIKELQQKCYDAMDDDFNSPMVIATLFDAIRIINLVNDKKESLSGGDIDLLKKIFADFVPEILGLKEEKTGDQNAFIHQLLDAFITLRQHARDKKDFAMADTIRNELAKLGIIINDTKDGAAWSIEK